MRVLDEIMKLKTASLDNNIKPKMLIISVRNLIKMENEERNVLSERDMMTAAKMLDVIEAYNNSAFYGLEVVIGRGLRVV